MSNERVVVITYVRNNFHLLQSLYVDFSLKILAQEDMKICICNVYRHRKWNTIIANIKKKSD